MKTCGTRILFILLSLLLLLGCDAPRENPVDPNNPDNKFASLSGTVKTEGFPFVPIKEINVFWENENILVQTSSSGSYSISDIKKIDGWLYFNGNGYSSDSIFIQWNDRKKINNEIFLNSNPVLDSLEFYSIVENRFQVNQIYRVVVRAKISDFEGVNDIDSVFLQNESLNINTQLLFNSLTGFYERTLGLIDLNVSALEEVIGKDFLLVVDDLEGRSFNVASTIIKRVINSEIELISPINNAAVTFPFSLRWRRFTPGFNFNYQIEISTNEIQPELVFRAENISPDSIAFLITNEFAGQDFFWAIWAIDEFKNRSRSKPGSFQIQN
jgi:hypothetical protein